MRKIKRLRHLKKERQRLRQKRTELETAIRSDWQGIRRNFEPASLAKEAFTASALWLKRKIFS